MACQQAKDDLGLPPQRASSQHRPGGDLNAETLVELAGKECDQQ